MTSLCCVWWCSDTTYMTSAFLKVKKSSSWKTLCLKRGFCLCPRPLARNRTKRILRCKWTLVAPVIETSESIEPNENDLQLNAVTYAFCKIFQPETCWNVENKLNSSFSDQELVFFVEFPFRGELRNEKRHFIILWKISLSSGSIYEHKNFYGGRMKVHQIDDVAKLSGELYLSLTSLAFMQLVPGDDRAVRHICIRCIALEKGSLFSQPKCGTP